MKFPDDDRGSKGHQLRLMFGWYLDIFFQAGGQLRAYPLRSFLTSLGVIIAVTGVISVAGVMSGLQAGVNRELAELGTETVVVGTNFRKVMSGFHTESLGHAEWQALQRTPGIEQSVASIAVSGKTVKSRHIGREAAVRVVGVSYQFQSLYRTELLAGRFLLPSDDAGHLRVCVIGSDLADRLGLGTEPVGHALQFGQLNFRVIGVIAANSERSHSATQFGDIYIPLTVADELNQGASSYELAFRMRDIGARDTVMRDVRQRLRQSLRTPPTEEDDFRMEDAAQLRRTNDAIIGMVALVLVLVVSITLLVGGVGIMNVMLVSVTERTQEIGLLRALGATKQQIRIQFLTEAAMLAGLGAFIGVAIGWAIASLIVYFIPYAANAAVPAWALAVSVASAIGVGLVAGSVPAFRAANLDPVLALSTQ